MKFKSADSTRIWMSALGLGMSLCVLGGACDTTTSTPVELTIFHTNDLHSHLRAAKSDPFGLGGLARISTLLTGLRASTPTSITLDAGDWSEGTWYYSTDEGANMLRFLNQLKYDGACLGNHDFLNGPDVLLKTLQAAAPAFPVLAGNLDMTSYSNQAQLRQAMPADAIKVVNGIKVGMIGLTTFGFMYNSFISPVNILNPIDSATALAKVLRPQVDVLLVISHNDFTTNQQIARDVPGVDAVISGHTHLKTPVATLVQNAGKSVPVVETGAWGKFLGDLKLEVDTVNHTVAFGSYLLHPVTPDIVEDPVVAQMVTAEDQKLDAKFNDDTNRVVGQSDLDLIQQDGSESTLGNLAVNAFESETGADLSMEEISLTGVSIAKGPMTLQDLHDVIPHIYNPSTGKEWTLKVWSASGADLFKIFDAFYTVSGLMSLSSPLGWLSADNVQLSWDPSISRNNPIPYSAIVSMTIAGKSLDPSAHYNVALDDGLLSAITEANNTFSLGTDLSQVRDTGEEAWRAVVNYAASKKVLTVADLRIGQHATAKGADLGVFYYGVDWDGQNLSVEVDNIGGAASDGSASLTCFTGKPNGLVDFNTSQQVWTPIATVALSSLSPGTSTTVQVPWSNAGLAKGYWPINCTVSGGGDTYSSNNEGDRVFLVN